VTLWLLVLLVACDAQAPAANAPAAPPPTARGEAVAAPTARAETAACRVNARYVLTKPSSAPQLIALTSDQAGGLLLWVDASGATWTLTVDAAGRSEAAPSALALPRARGLLSFTKLGGGFLAITEGACEAASHCLYGLRLDARGEQRGQASITPLAAAPLTLRRRVLGSRLLLALSTRHAAPRLFTYAPSEAGLELTTRVLSEGAWPEESDATILALTTDAERWAVLYRVGPTEAPTSEVRLALADGMHEVPTLAHALAVDALSFEGDGLTALVSYEFFRPKLHRLHLDGGAHVEARELSPGAALPGVFRAKRRAHLEHGDELRFVLRNAAGDRIGAELTLDPNGRAPADVARVGDGYLVIAFLDGQLRALGLTCANP